MEPTDEQIGEWVKSIQVEAVLGANQAMTFKVLIPVPSWLPEELGLSGMAEGWCTSDVEQATWAEYPDLHESIKQQVRFEAAESVINTLEEKFG